MGPGEEEDDEEAAANEGHVEEDGGVDEGLEGVGDPKAKEAAQDGEAGVDEEELVPKADEVDANEEAADFLFVSDGGHGPLAEELVVEELAVAPLVRF